MAGTRSVLKGKEKIKECVEIDDTEGESDPWIGQQDEEDDDDSEENEDSDSEEEEEEESEEEYDDEQSESDPEDNESDESFDDDDEYRSISDDRNIEDDANNVSELSDKVVNLLRQRNQKMDVLKLEECKAYLRKHELMISGSKAACIQRILEHWRLKDGNGERFYPKSSFTINCTGDVCKGDIVMFKQRVYEKFNKVSRSGKMLGRRTLAGRIVKESYGLAKQQHTFTVEVLWSKGVKPLPSLYTLLVKGRNLYRYRTFRQVWHDEAERCKILEEKHRRGATARHVRATNQSRSYAGTKHQRKPSISKLPNKRPKRDSKATPRKKRKKTCSIKNHASATSLSKLTKKLRTKASSSSAQSKKSKTMTKSHGTKVSLPLAQSKKAISESSSYTHQRQVNHHETVVNPLHNSVPRQDIRNICYENWDSHLHQRNTIAAAPPTVQDPFYIPSYNYNYIVPPLQEPLHHHVHHHQGHHHHGHHHHQMMEQTNYTIPPYAAHASQLYPRENVGRPYSAFILQNDSRRSGHFFAPAMHDNNFPWR